MNRYITQIHINSLYHLRNIDITISEESSPHLIITGKNGSGKTVLLNAVSDYLDFIRTDKSLAFLDFRKHLEECRRIHSKTIDEAEKRKWENHVNQWERRIDSLEGKVSLSFSNVTSLIDKYQEGSFILAFYQATRKPSLVEPKNPTKPEVEKQGLLKESATSQFLNYLSDLKIQEALARNENEIADADEIKRWFDEFESVLRKLFQDADLRLEFNYKDYSFHILTEGRSFKFTEVSDGFAAVLDIVMDLILKMQVGSQNSLRTYQEEGIVLIDEIETHLHLGLQKAIMPFLTALFPKIQFIVTTHSPFILSSMSNAVAFDLERKESIMDLTDYSYESLAEGYFGVRTPSSYMEMQIDDLHKLLEKNNKSGADLLYLKQLITDFEKIPEIVSPLIVGQYRQLKSKYYDIIGPLL